MGFTLTYFNLFSNFFGLFCLLIFVWSPPGIFNDFFYTIIHSTTNREVKIKSSFDLSRKTALIYKIFEWLRLRQEVHGPYCSAKKHFLAINEREKRYLIIIYNHVDKKKSKKYKPQEQNFCKNLNKSILGEISGGVGWEYLDEVALGPMKGNVWAVNKFYLMQFLE